MGRSSFSASKELKCPNVETLRQISPSMEQLYGPPWNPSTEGAEQFEVPTEYNGSRIMDTIVRTLLESLQGRGRIMRHLPNTTRVSNKRGLPLSWGVRIIQYGGLISPKVETLELMIPKLETIVFMPLESI